MMSHHKCIGALFVVMVCTINLLSVDAFSVWTPPFPCRPLVARGTQQTWKARCVQLSVASRDSQEATVDALERTVTARSVAAHALLADTKKKQSIPSLQRLESDPSFKSIDDQRDRSFARLLVTTVERRLGQIDKVLAKCQKSNKQQKVTSILFMDTLNRYNHVNNKHDLVFYRIRKYEGMTCIFNHVFESGRHSYFFSTFLLMQRSRKRLMFFGRMAESKCRE